VGRLYVLVDGRSSMQEFCRLVELLLQGGADMLQLRDKRLTDRELLERAHALRALTRSGDALFIINDRADLAALAHADGVHLGQEEIGVKEARAILGTQALIGISTHTIEQARQAVLDGASYLGCGPTFPSQTKQFAEFPGPQFLRQVSAEIRLRAEPQTLWFWRRDAARDGGLRRGGVGRRGGRRARWACVPSEIHAVSERRSSNAGDAPRGSRACRLLNMHRARTVSATRRRGRSSCDQQVGSRSQDDYVNRARQAGVPFMWCSAIRSATGPSVSAWPTA